MWTPVISITLLLVVSIPSTHSLIECPEECYCKWELDSLAADCSGHKLVEVPREILILPIEILDLSNNEFEEFPMELQQMSSIQHLKISHNKLTSMPNDTLRILPNLISLDLSYNRFANLKDIHPATLLLGAKRLTNLSLAGNTMEIFTDVDETILLKSESLINLDMSYCKISKAIGTYVLSDIPNLETLVLNGNEFGSLVSFPATNIHTLVLSDCSLTKLGNHFFDNIKYLENLDLSHNTGITFGTEPADILDSTQLKILDLSYCNLVDFDTRGFPNLISLNLQGNMIRKVTAEHLAQNSALKKVNLSNNGIRAIDIRAFEELALMEELDLSYNNLQSLEDNLFQDNPALISLNLGRNFFKNIGHLNIQSLEILNFGWCEVESVSADSLENLPKLKTLILSNNLVSMLPTNWGSKTVKVLNLRMNRLVLISDSTFRNFPSLEALDVSGNRLSNPFTERSFRQNTHLDQIWLGDNIWKCDCYNESFKSFYDYISGSNTGRSKIQDPRHLRCQSPPNHAGRTWENACFTAWNPPASRASNQHIMTGILCTIVIIAGLLFAASCVKKYLHNRRKRQNEDELRDNVREMRNIQRMNNEFLASQQNISQPAIRESNPPCYEEALLMPKMERNFKSMDDISTRKGKKKLSLSPTIIDIEQNSGSDQSPPMKSKNRFRSEQFLNRDLERTAAITPYPRSGRAVNNSGSRVFAYEDGHFASSQVKLGNLQMAEQGNDFKDYDYSPYTKRKNKELGRQSSFQIAIADRKSIEFLTDSECSSIQNSPFARRKPIGSSNSILSTHKNKSSLSLRPIEDHFGSNKNKSMSSNEFVKMSADPSESDLSMVGDAEEICAVVHQPPEVSNKSPPPARKMRTCSTDL